MTRATKLTDEVSEAICAHARQGMPLVRAAALSRVNRVTVWRWQSEGSAEIDAADDDAELGLRGRFALNYGQARASYLLELSDAWKGAIKRKDANTAKQIQSMLSSQSPDEFSERRAIRSVNQTTTLQGEIGVGRFASMSAEDLAAERQRLMDRMDAAQAGAADDSWRSAAVRMPHQGTEEDLPERAAEENTSTVEKPDSGSQTRKSRSDPLPLDDSGVSQKNTPSRARTSDASVVDGPSVLVPGGSAPDHGEGAATLAGAAPSSSDDDDEETQL